MPPRKIRLTNSYGRSLPFEPARIKSALVGRNAGVPEMWGESHVWAEDPLMILLSRERCSKRGTFTLVLIELYENSRGKLDELVHLELPDEKLDTAIKIFMDLCKKPKKTKHERVLRELGSHAIFIKDAAVQGDPR